MILETVLILLVLALIAIPVSMIFGKIYKNSAKNVKEGIRFIYRFIPRHLPMPDVHTSTFFNRYPDKSNKWTTDMWRMCPTINDPWLIELSKIVDKECEGKSDRYKAGYILAITQCLYTYKKDVDTYGQTDRWQFPVCTAYLRTGDCEDGAFFGAGLSKLCGLDTIVIYENGHALYGVNVKGFGFKVTHNDKHYLKCETTSILPLGIVLNDKPTIGTYDIVDVTSEFMTDRTFHDDFAKYKE